MVARVAADAASDIVRGNYFERELSWLDFNGRVLGLAGDQGLPLLERVKFLAIFATNLDEFFQVRVASLKDKLAANQESGASLVEPERNLVAVALRTRSLVASHGQAYHGLMDELAAVGVQIVTVSSLDVQDRRQLSKVFEAQVLPVLTPLAVDASHPFPYISNLSLNLGVMVALPEEGDTKFARVKVPSNLPRLIAVAGSERFVLLEDLLACHLDLLFPGMDVIACHAFRVTRNADLDIQDDEADDLLATVEMELRQRRFGRAVRLEVAAATGPDMVQLLCAELELDSDDVYQVDAPLDLSALWELLRIERPELKAEPWASVVPAMLAGAEESGGILSVIRQHDVLVHHPYESFAASVEAFLHQAAEDPLVLAIKLTLYRTSGDSPIVSTLIRAAERGKQVVVLVELQARFDEENNIAWARKLEQAGAHVMYGLVGLKTHAKAVLVVRADEDGLRRYCHFGTGNYNSSTARLYEDVGLLTANEVLGADLAALYNTLTGFSQAGSYAELLVAPATVRSGVIERIQAEAAAGPGVGRILFKMNSLVDRAIIDALYEASAAGIEIDLIVRGICCLRPGVAGLSETIKVHSIVGRYLEHSRIYCFGGTPKREVQLLIGSADLMPRNLDRRVEVLVPVLDEACQQRLLEALELCKADDTNAWVLHSDGCWQRRDPVTATDMQEQLHNAALRRCPPPEIPGFANLMSRVRPEYRGERTAAMLTPAAERGSPLPAIGRSFQGPRSPLASPTGVVTRCMATVAHRVSRSVLRFAQRLQGSGGEHSG